MRAAAIDSMLKHNRIDHFMSRLLLRVYHRHSRSLVLSIAFDPFFR